AVHPAGQTDRLTTRRRDVLAVDQDGRRADELGLPRLGIGPDLTHLHLHGVEPGANQGLAQVPQSRVGGRAALPPQQLDIGHAHQLQGSQQRPDSLPPMPHNPNPFGDDLFGSEHVRVYRETGGEPGYRWRGTTILLLTTTGRMSGHERTTPLIFTEDGERWVVVASKGGAPAHPDWYKNLQA